MGSYSDIPADELIQRWKDMPKNARQCSSNNRDEDDQNHYYGLGDRLDRG
jgi:hypothetical protein